jgi:hypothetical protein
MTSKYEWNPLNEGVERPFIGEVLFRLYRLRKPFLRRRILHLARRLEKGEMYSVTMRRIFRHYHKIKVGFYTGGGSFRLGNFKDGLPGVEIGRYCSIAFTARSFNANHPMNVKSTHAFFYNPVLGWVNKDDDARLVP